MSIIGFDKLSLGRHITSTPYCSFSNNQKRVLHSQLLDNYQATVVSNKQNPMITSYGCKRFSANGTEDTIQINSKNDTVERRNIFLRNTSNKQQYLSPIDKSISEIEYRTAASMSGNQFWADCEIGGYESSITSQSSLSDMDSNGLLNGTLTHEDQNIISADKDNLDITVSQKDIIKRMSNLSVNCLDEFQLDLFHTLKASDAPLVFI